MRDGPQLTKKMCGIKLIYVPIGYNYNRYLLISKNMHIFVLNSLTYYLNIYNDTHLCFG